jgi:uncharacterized protein (DUF433 family)
MIEKENFFKRIVIDPKIMVGKPIIKGTRVTVQYILGLLAQGMSTAEILDEYKQLTQEDVFACLFFAQKCN